MQACVFILRLNREFVDDTVGRPRPENVGRWEWEKRCPPLRGSWRGGAIQEEGRGSERDGGEAGEGAEGGGGSCSRPH